MIAFHHVGTWGTEEFGPLHYPWDRWLDGQTWGFCPEKAGTTAESFRRTLRERAQKRGGGEFVVNACRIHGRDWVVFNFERPRDPSEKPLPWLESASS